MVERLQLKKDEPAQEQLTCPSCGKPMAVGAVLCVQCGFDTRTGRRMGEFGARKLSPLLTIGLLLVALSAGFVLYLRSLDDGIQPTPIPVPPSDSPVALAAGTTEPDAAPAAPAEAPAPTDTAESSGPASSTETNVEATADTSEEPAAPAIDWEEVAARQQDRIKAELDRRTPMFAEGESVELRQGNGLIRRGIFRGLLNNTIQLEVEEKAVQEVPLDLLDRHTRLRVDVEYRARYVDYLTRQRIAEMKRAQ